MRIIEVTQRELQHKKIYSDYAEWCKRSDGYHWVMVKCEKCEHLEFHYSHVQTTRGCRYLLTGICGHLFGRLTEKTIPINAARRDGWRPLGN